LLVTAFEPFAGDRVNASEQVLRRLAASGSAARHNVETRILPVTRESSLACLIGAIEAVNPETTICLGQASGRSSISVEKVALNHCAFPIPDAEGCQPQDEPVDARGPAAYFSSLPVNALVAAIREADIPASVSYSAGTYVCNCVFYGLMRYTARHRPDMRAGLIHVPALPEQATEESAAGMPLDDQVSALVRVLDCLAGTSIDSVPGNGVIA
jgi:pyroglutamyl-peptidase